MFRRPEADVEQRSSEMELAAAVELTPDQLEEASGGCFYGHGLVGPTLVLSVLVAVLIG
jgi:hypothetical protein